MIRLTPSEILSIVHKLGIQYEDKGNYIKFKCVNEVHNDTHPSMTMLKNNGYCKCWSCGVTYNFYAFVTKLSNGDYSRYIKDEKTLTRLFNQTLDEPTTLVMNKEEPKRKMKVQQGYLYNPIRSTKVLDYLRRIHVNETMIEEFDIRYTEKASISFSNGRGTFITNRICIPIIEQNKIVNMECRDYTEEQNLKVIYPKGSKADVLWNWESIQLNKPVYVVEGIKSAFRIYKYVSKNVVATLGSALGNNQKKLLNKIKSLILFPDNDDAGRSMINQINKFYDYDYFIVFMPKVNQDPADGTLKELEYAVNNPIESVDWRLSKYDFYNELRSRRVAW
jgi:DNA primase